MPKIQVRRALTADWVARNPVLSLGEPGMEIETKLLKIGDGVTHWTALPYFTGDQTFAAAVAAAATAALTTALGSISTSATRTNLAVNPLGVNSGGWGSTSAAQYGARATTTTTLLDGTSSPAMIATRTTTTPTSVLASWTFAGQIDSLTTGGFPVTPGETYAVSAMWSCTRDSRAQINIKFVDGAGTQVGSIALTPLVSAAAGASGRMFGAVVAPAGAVAMTDLRPNVLTQDGTNSVGGEVTVAGKLLVEHVATLKPYFDGGSGAAGGVSHTWAGTANASQSNEVTITLSGYAKSSDVASTYVATPQAAVDYVRQSAAPVLGSGTGTNNIYTVQFSTASGTAPPTGGTFQLVVTTPAGTQTTAALAYNCTAADVLAALLALSNVGAGNVTVVLSGSRFIVTFAVALGVLSMAGINSTTAAHPGPLLQVFMSKGLATMFTAVANTALQSVKLTNTSSTQQVNIDLYDVLTGQTATLGLNDVAVHFTIQPGDSAEFVADANGRYELAGKVMAAGDKLQVAYDYSAILAYTVTGVSAP